MNFSTRFIRALKLYMLYRSLAKGCGVSTPYPYCVCEPPAPRLSFSCVKKKDGGERKSLRGTIRRAWGDTPHWKNVAAPRSSSPHRGNKTLLKPLCRCGLRSPAREIQTFSARVAIGTPASCRGSPFCFLPAPPRACVTTRTEKSGDQLPRGSAAQGEQRDKGGPLCPCRSRRLRPPSPYGDP